MATDLNDILKLSIDERLEIIEKIWESIEQNDEVDKIPEWHRKILEERFKKHKNNILAGKSWEEVKTNLLRRW
jgi:putative addiction module component (TIGR02574 family)